MIKEELYKNDIPFLERDIDDYSEEYDEFAKATNEYVPALMLLTLDEK